MGTRARWANRCENGERSRGKRGRATDDRGRRRPAGHSPAGARVPTRWWPRTRPPGSRPPLPVIILPFSVDDPARTNGVRVGDRCVWHDGNQYNKGTIRFVGYLKGHTNLYAGVEFDDAVGKGTGVFQGETVFTTAENRAGFVVLTSLEILPRPSEMNGDKQLAVKHKQASRIVA